VRRFFSRFGSFLRGESIVTNRDQTIWALKIFGLALVIGLLVSPFALLVVRASAADGGGPVIGPVPGVASPQSPGSSTSTPGSSGDSGVPVKGLTDEPTYRWWSLPNAPQPESWWAQAQNPQKLQVQISLMHELGVKLLRVELAWALVAPTMPGGSSYDSAVARNPNWSGYQWQAWDALVRLATSAGLQLVPQVVYSPDWASGLSVDQDGPESPPQSAQYYGDFVFAAITRYKGQIHYWEMWNEPNLDSHYWNGTPKQYVDLILKPGYQAVKQVDPTAKVLIAGLVSGGPGFLSDVYADGGGPYFDIANAHAYFPVVDGVSTAVHLMKGVMHDNGDSQKPVWLTEFGLEAQPNNEAEQAQLITDVFSNLNVQAILYYQLHDTAAVGLNGPGALAYYGLVSSDYSHRKLGFAAYKAAAGGALPPLARASSSAALTPSLALLWPVGQGLMLWQEQRQRVEASRARS
jgi:hypothetical protein